MNKTRVAVKAVIVCNGCFLLLERRQNGEEGIYDLPGGGVETGESHTQALTREIFEETGLTVRIKRPLRTWSFSPRAGETLYGVTFLAEYLSGTVRLSAEHGSWQWFPFSRTADAGLPRWIRDESALAAEAVERERDAFSVTRIHRGIYGIIRREGKILLIRKNGDLTPAFSTCPTVRRKKAKAKNGRLPANWRKKPAAVCKVLANGGKKMSFSAVLSKTTAAPAGCSTPAFYSTAPSTAFPTGTFPTLIPTALHGLTKRNRRRKMPRRWFWLLSGADREEKTLPD